MSAARASVGVVGGGVMGMVLALRLRERGHPVTLIEASAATGGLAAPQQIGDFTWDRFYHVIVPSDATLLALLDDLQLTEFVRWNTTRTGFFTGGRMHSMSSTLEFLRFPPLSLVGKARLARTIMYASRLRDWRRLEAIPVEQWLRRWSGNTTFERIWRPLLKAKLGDNYRLASAAFIWAIIARMYAARRSGLKREQLGYVEGGYDLVLRRLRERLAAAGVEQLCGQPVRAVSCSASAATVELADGSRREFDAAVLTIPATRIPAVCPGLNQAERERLQGVVYQGIVCSAVLLREPLAGFYVTNITDEWVPFTAVIEMTALTGRERFSGLSLVYLPRYLTQEDSWWSRSDAEVRSEFEAALARMYPGFHPGQVVAWNTSRVREVLALSTLHYSDRALPSLQTSLPRVFIANSAQIAHGTLNLNETVGVAESAAGELDGVLAGMAGTPVGSA